jgi:hypothetical protein
MPRYSTFKYFKKLYGDVGVSRSSSLLFAQVIDYTQIRLTAEVPNQVGVAYALIRSNNGAAEDPSQGKTIASGVFTSRIAEFSDDLVSFADGVLFTGTSDLGASAYYTLFTFDDDGAWVKQAATSIVVPKDKKSVTQMTDLFPTVFVSTDEDILFPPNLVESDLYKFLYGLALTYDEMSTMIDFILPENRDRQVTRRLHQILATGVGMPNEYTIGVAADARLKRNAGYIYRNKGSLAGVSTYVEALTGWNSIAIPSSNKFLSLDDGSFEYSVGNWVVQEDEATLVRVEIDNNTVFGPPMPYETTDYPFSKLGLGELTLLDTVATRMSLPGTADRELCIPVSAGATHYLSIPVKAVQGTPTLSPIIEWLDQRGIALGTSSIGNVECSDEWQFCEGTVAAPPDAYFAVVHLDVQGEMGDVIHLDCLSFTEGVVLRRTNFVTNADASDGVEGISALNSVDQEVTTSSDRVWVGGESFKITHTGSSQPLGIITTEAIAAVPAETYTGSVYVNPTRPTRVRLSFDWRNDDTSVVVSTSSYQLTLEDRWTRVFYTVTAPDGVDNLQLRVETEDSFTGSEALYLDGLLIEQSPNLGEFFIGTTGNTYGSSNTYGTFVYSRPEFGFVYRDPRSVTVICQPDRINLVFDPSFELPNPDEITDPGISYEEAEELATPWSAETGSFETTTERFQTGTRSGKASGDEWEVYGPRVPVVGTFPYSIAATASSDGEAACEMVLYWYDYSDTFVGSSSLQFTDLSSEWSREQGSVTAPPTASYAVIGFRGSGTVYLDNAMMERADRPQYFFSGDVSNVDNTDGRWSNPGTRAYALLYNNAPIKLGRLKQTLPYYLPQGMIGRVLLWDSPDPEVQALIPRGLYDEG